MNAPKGARSHIQPHQAQSSHSGCQALLLSAAAVRPVCILCRMHLRAILALPVHLAAEFGTAVNLPSAAPGVCCGAPSSAWRMTVAVQQALVGVRRRQGKRRQARGGQGQKGGNKLLGMGQGGRPLPPSSPAMMMAKVALLHQLDKAACRRPHAQARSRGR